MGKMKLKTVQNGLENQSASLMANGSSTYRNENGYIVDGSGIFDASGNVVESDWLEILGGYDIIQSDGYPSFNIEVKWGSGSIELPLPYSSDAEGLSPCVDTSFHILYCNAPFVGNIQDDILNIRWATPITAHIQIPFYIPTSNGNLYTKVFLYARFDIPFIPHLNDSKNSQD